MIASQAKGMVGQGLDNPTFGDLTAVAFGNHSLQFSPQTLQAFDLGLDVT
jgi:hypothetical protein